MHKLLLAFLLIGHLAFGQTGSHIKVPGTKCSLIPPEGFLPTTEFSGFWNEEISASILVNVVNMSYQKVIQGSFTAESLKERDITFVGKQTVDFNNSKAILVKATQTAHGIPFIKQMLVFGDDKETVIISGIYPESLKSIEGKIIDAMFSTVYNKSETVNLLDAVPFTLNVEGTGFKVTSAIGGGLIYSPEDKALSKQLVLMVMSSLGNGSGPDRKRFAEESLKKNPFGLEKIREINEITIDSLKGYEIVAEVETKEVLYQVMLFHDNGDYYFILACGGSFESYLGTYRKIARTFKRK